MSNNIQANASDSVLSSTDKIEVNESFKPTQLPGLKLWLRSDLGVSVSVNNVTAWADQSGNGFNLSQGTVTQQPTYVPSGQNQLPAIRFDGANDILIAASPIITGAGDFSIFLVTAPMGSTADCHMCGNYSSTNTSGLQCWLTASKMSAYINPVTTTGTTAVTPYQVTLFHFRRNTGTVTLRLNETQEAQQAAAAAIVGNTNWAIANYAALLEPYQGDYYEHIIFNRTLTENERIQVSTYLKQRYGIL